jgi:hypothetical protein
LIFSSTDKSNLFAQTSEKDTTNNTLYFLVTPGIGLMKNSADLTVFGIGFYLRIDHISFRFFHVKEACIAIRSTCRNLDYQADLGVMYSIFKDDRWYFASVSAGIAYTYGRYSIYDTDNHPEFKTVGLPIEAKVFLKPFPAFGIGVILFANINSEQSIHGYFICFQIGRP